LIYLIPTTLEWIYVEIRKSEFVTQFLYRDFWILRGLLTLFHVTFNLHIWMHNLQQYPCFPCYSLFLCTSDLCSRDKQDRTKTSILSTLLVQGRAKSTFKNWAYLWIKSNFKLKNFENVFWCFYATINKFTYYIQ